MVSIEGFSESLKSTEKAEQPKKLTRIEEAKRLRRQGLTIREIASVMGIKLSSAKVYVYWKLEYGQRLREKVNKWKDKINRFIKKELSHFGLPSEWEDELLKLYVVYRIAGEKGRGRGRDNVDKLDVRSLIVLLCRQKKVPTPRKLELLTYQGRGSRRVASGYMDVLSTLDGVEPAKPIDYIRYFQQHEGLGYSVVKVAEHLIEQIPKHIFQSRNPRSLAGAVLYEIYKSKNPEQQGNRIFTQKYIAKILKITEVSLRNNWRQLFVQNGEIL